MKTVELVVETDVASFMFRECERGVAFSELIGERCSGITVQSIAEFHAGIILKNWRREESACSMSFWPISS